MAQAKTKRKRASRGGRQRHEPAAKRGTTKPGRAAPTGRGGRGRLKPPPQPSWRRSIQRAAIFAALGVVFISLIQHTTVTQAIVNFVLFWVLLTPTQYLADRIANRTASRMAARIEGRRSKRP